MRGRWGGDLDIEDVRSLRVSKENGDIKESEDSENVYKGSPQRRDQRTEEKKTRDKGFLGQVHICVMGGMTLLREYKG